MLVIRFNPGVCRKVLSSDRLLSLANYSSVHAVRKLNKSHEVFQIVFSILTQFRFLLSPVNSTILVRVAEA
ncbi:hypothetical protein OMCYN_01102 [cyanobiont of Ornithocercus magnificus]|nr:hypothetical protein OMCYN_01102 [cyanobiont of Ornithocercus magnificus]